MLPKGETRKSGYISGNGWFSDSFEMLEKRKSMANLTMMYKKVDLITWLEEAMAVYEKNK